MTAFAVDRPTSRLARLAPRVRAVLAALGIVLIAVVLGVAGGRVAISHYGVGAIAVLVGVPALAWLWPRPLVALMLVLAVMSVVEYGTIPRVPVPGHPPFNTTDLVMLLVVIGTLWRNRWSSWPREARRMGLALGLLLGLALIPTGILLTQGHDPAREAILGYKDLLYLAVALTVAVEYRGRRLRPALNVAIVIAVLVALLSIAAAVSSGAATSLNQLNSQAVQAGSQLTNGATRIRLLGLFFTYAMIFPTIAMAFVVRDRWRLARALAVIPMLAAVALSLNRNMIFGLGAGLLIAIALGGRRLRFRALVTFVTLAAVIAIVVQSAVLPAAAGKVISRASSGFSTQVLKTSSITTREDEFTHAIQSIERHPWFGVGWYQPYGAYDFSDSYNPFPRPFVENLYLHFATDFGLPVLAAFLVFCATVAAGGLAAIRRGVDPVHRAYAAGGIGALVALLLSCLVGTYMQDINSVPMFAFICGFIAASACNARATPASPTHASLAL